VLEREKNETRNEPIEISQFQVEVFTNPEDLDNLNFPFRASTQIHGEKCAGTQSDPYTPRSAINIYNRRRRETNLVNSSFTVTVDLHPVLSISFVAPLKTRKIRI
jgi:hypothetical protein